MANIEDRLKNLEKRLSYNKVVVGILAFCLVLALAAHLDAQPKPPGLGTRPGSQQIDSRRLNQILAKIEQRLTSLEKQSISHQPSAPAMHQPGSSFGQASIEKRLTALENQAGSQQTAAPATEQTGSAVGELTCTKLTVVNSQGQPIFEVMDHSTGGQALLYAPDGDPRIIMRVSPHHGGAHVNLYGGSGLSAGISLDAGRTGTGSTVSVFDPSDGYMKDLARKSHTH
jgi:uncharacterized coiled-coil protein SlyX